MQEVLPVQPRFPLQNPEVQATIAAWVVEGLTHEAIAARLATDLGITVTRQAVSHLLANPESRVARQMQRALDKVTDFAIADKTHRVRKLDKLATKLEEKLDEEGVTYTEETRHSRRIHAHPAVGELRAVYSQVATELDQLPRAGITIANQNVVIVKQVTTEDANPEL